MKLYTDPELHAIALKARLDERTRILIVLGQHLANDPPLLDRILCDILGAASITVLPDHDRL